MNNTKIDLGNGWSIGKYDDYDYDYNYDVYHSGCTDGAIERPYRARRLLGKVGTPDDVYCNRCNMKAPDEVVGMLHLCRWNNE